MKKYNGKMKNTFSQHLNIYIYTVLNILFIYICSSINSYKFQAKEEIKYIYEIYIFSFFYCSIVKMKKYFPFQNN